MDYNSLRFDSPNENQAGPSSSGLTLVIPSLKALKELKKKGKTLEDVDVKKTPRPIKLKPLKEVLTTLITKIKKKDAYAFFLRPVDASKVQGYADVIKRPMDFGTMTSKVERNKYRSLEEFAADFHLVASNAKTFNPPGTLYHTEAERIETWGSEHIAKAAAHVIEYETDWNIEIERDEDMNVDADAEEGISAGAAGSVEPGTPARRSPSVTSAAAISAKRSRGVGKKGTGMLSETVEADGHLPGFKDGLSAFPPGSDWAELMVALKLKGKRYRTKKERMRMERGGPPFAPDGSIDYAEMEDPFSVLSVFVPEAASRPQLTPVYPPSASSDPSQIYLPAPINVPVPDERSPPEIPKSSSSKYRYWTINRNVSSRGKPKEKEDEEPAQPRKNPRDMHATDFGAFATLAARVAQETPVEDASAAFGSEDKLFDAIRASVETPAVGAKPAPSAVDELIANGAGYWTRERACRAQDYLREVVYGGVDGLAYIRSIAEFVSPPDDAMDVHAPSALGMSLAKYVEETLIDPLTEGRHRILHETVRHLSYPNFAVSSELAKAVYTSEHVRPHAMHTVALFQQLFSQPLDLAALINAPEELYAAEGALAALGRGEGATADDDPVVLGRALRHAADLLERVLRQRQESGGVGDEREEKELRLILIALAKRAPLDQIARMPAELVPAHLRRVVPTIGY
ncbi:hypothetical protein EW146_g5058 [Bondarzewia mesenterica]|uniref:Bromo domain-containing protein n=1 Tax=Bondarzewia mesenterica TaxID=1095465 RepID=A0A4S4LTP0_9AGAM|nr:hypothetical protein EW146_g5058 [Bondarzewia mesenterica]